MFCTTCSLKNSNKSINNESLKSTNTKRSSNKNKIIITTTNDITIITAAKLINVNNKVAKRREAGLLIVKFENFLNCRCNHQKLERKKNAESKIQRK